MKAFKCTCGQPLFFDNLECLSCGRQVAYDPVGHTLVNVEPADGGLWIVSGDDRTPPPQYRLCAHRTAPAACNWLVPATEPQAVCLSCRLTRTVPLLDDPKDEARLRELESAKRRVLFALQELDLPLIPKSDDGERGLAFDFLEPLAGAPPVMTGHDNGLITLNVAEADDDYREKNRENLQEPYRTVIGHIRHELGHYYWDVLVRDDTSWLGKFRELFGDDRLDYSQALQKHYSEGPPPDWQSNFISAYAASHPWEDWAESWAHYLHMQATLETVTSYHLHSAETPLHLTPFSADALYEKEADPAFLDWVNSWVVLTATLNEVARSMGQPDIYPFVLNLPAVKKIHFIHCLINDRRLATTPPVPQELAVPTAG
ncbi:MAG: putative zinc-binding metallopeptidase [Rhodospirillales bacterium]